MKKPKLKTVRTNYENHLIIGTQEEISKDCGHYKIVIINDRGHIVSTVQSCYGVPDIKMDENFLILKYIDDKRWRDYK